MQFLLKDKKIWVTLFIIFTEKYKIWIVNVAAGIIIDCLPPIYPKLLMIPMLAMLWYFKKYSTMQYSMVQQLLYLKASRYSLYIFIIFLVTF